MANRTLLVVSDSADPPSEYEPSGALLGANYSVPLLWLSLFATGDIVSWPSTLDSASMYAAALSRRDACIARSRRRVAEWSRLWPRTFNELGPTWLAFIGATPEEFLSVWTEELADMYASSEEWLLTFKSYLEALDRPHGLAFLDVLAQSYLAIDADGTGLIGTSPEPLGLLAGGFSWAAQAPWK